MGLRIFELPEDIIFYEIISRLDPPSVVSLRRTCKHLATEIPYPSEYLLTPVDYANACAEKGYISLLLLELDDAFFLENELPLNFLHQLTLLAIQNSQVDTFVALCDRFNHLLDDSFWGVQGPYFPVSYQIGLETSVGYSGNFETIKWYLENRECTDFTMARIRHGILRSGNLKSIRRLMENDDVEFLGLSETIKRDLELDILTLATCPVENAAPRQSLDVVKYCIETLLCPLGDFQSLRNAIILGRIDLLEYLLIDPYSLIETRDCQDFMSFAILNDKFEAVEYLQSKRQYSLFEMTFLLASTLCVISLRTLESYHERGLPYDPQTLLRSSIPWLNRNPRVGPQERVEILTYLKEEMGCPIDRSIYFDRKIMEMVPVGNIQESDQDLYRFGIRHLFEPEYLSDFEKEVWDWLQTHGVPFGFTSEEYHLLAAAPKSVTIKWIRQISRFPNNFHLGLVQYVIYHCWTQSTLLHEADRWPATVPWTRPPTISDFIVETLNTSCAKDAREHGRTWSDFHISAVLFRIGNISYSERMTKIPELKMLHAMAQGRNIDHLLGGNDKLAWFIKYFLQNVNDLL